MKVRRYQVRGGLPIVPGAVAVVAEAAGWVTAYYPPLGHGGHVSLRRLIGDLYVATAEGGAPEPPGIPWRRWIRTVAGRAVGYYYARGTLDTTDDNGNPIAIPWVGLVRDSSRDLEKATDARPIRVGPVLVRAAEPSLPSVCGAVKASLVRREAALERPSDAGPRPVEVRR